MHEIKKKNEKTYVTYKIDNFDNKGIWVYSDEYETEVENFEKIKDIIRLLGLKELLTIHNKKTIYITDKYEIALEEVEELGSFLEVEYCTDDDVDVKQEKNEIQRFIDDLGISASEELHMGKPEMIIKKGVNIENA